MAPAKKKPTPRKRSKVAAETTAKTKKAAPARKATTAKGKGKATKATPAKKSTPRAYDPRPIEYTDEGFQVGSDSAIIATALVTGAPGRSEVNALAEEGIAAASGLTTRTGREKYVPSMVSSILARMLATGEYEVEASWKLVKK